MTDTPETDAAWSCFTGNIELLQDVKDLSCKLERERDEAIEMMKRTRHNSSQIIASQANENILLTEQRDRLAENLEIALNATVLNHRNDRWHMDAEHTLQLIKQND